MRALAELARLVAEEPWALTPAHRTAWHAAGLGDDDVLHAIALAAFFGHLNRIADAVAVPLDYHVHETPPHAVPSTPALAAAPAQLAGVPALDLASRRATADALHAWETALFDRDAPLPRADRAALAAHVAGLFGDPPPPPSPIPPAPIGHRLDPALAALADVLTLAPWRLGDEAFGDLRATGAPDALLFDICMVASTAGMHARIRVALVALGR